MSVPDAEDEAEFWRFLEDAQFCDGQCKHAHDRIARQFSRTRVRLLHLERRLSRSSTAEIWFFHQCLVKVHRAAYRRDIWTAFELVLGRLSAIEFGEAIGWLVLQHKDFYYAMLGEPDLLAEVEIEQADLRDGSGIEEVARAALLPDPPDGDSQTELDEYFALLEEHELDPLELIVYPDLPAGDPLPAEPATLRRRFPRITGLYFPGEQLALPSNLASLSG